MIFTGRGNAGKAPIHKGIRIKENIQIVPPRNAWRPQLVPYSSEMTPQREHNVPYSSKMMQTGHDMPQQPSQQQQQEWATVGKKGRIVRKERTGKKSKSEVRKEKRRLPKTAAISIKGSNGDFSYADALKRARSEISLKDLDIQSPRIRKGMSGTTIIEISGSDNVEKADRLAAEMQKILLGEALVTRPNIRDEIRLSGLDESITTDEVRAAVANKGSCKPEERKIGKIGRHVWVLASYGCNALRRPRWRWPTKSEYRLAGHPLGWSSCKRAPCNATNAGE